MASSASLPDAEPRYTPHQRDAAYAQMRRLSVEEFYRARRWDPVAPTTLREAGWTALAMAAHIGHRGVVADLLRRGCDLQATNPGGWTALHAAVHGGHLDVVQALLEAGVDVNQPAEQGMTPLIQACILRASPALVAALLAATQQNPLLKDAFGCTAEHYALQTDNDAVLDLLQQYARQE